MSTEKSKKQVPSRAAKRARFTDQEEKKPGGASPLVLIGGIIVALVLIGGVVFALSGPPDTAKALPASGLSSAPESYRTGTQGLLVAAATIGHDPYPLAVAEDGVVRFPLATFDDYKAHYYTYMHEGRPIGIQLPEQVTLAISETEPTVKGQTAASSYKPAILENGVRVMVPPFVGVGENIVVQTEDLKYLRRAE